MKHLPAPLAIALVLCSASCAEKKTEPKVETKKDIAGPAMNDATSASRDASAKPGALEQVSFGAGCFWCVEAIFQKVQGVVTVESGYQGGKPEHPSYRQVCEGDTNHAEVCHITYDPSKVAFAKLLEVFWKTHDPTTLNRQGADEGTQYRSVIFYYSPEQKALAEKYKKELDAAHIWDRPIVTEITSAPTFWKAEDYHQNYFNTNPDKGYCRMVIQPKVDKFKKIFGDVMKKSD